MICHTWRTIKPIDGIKDMTEKKKTIDNGSSLPLTIVYRCLLVLTALIALAIITGTVYAYISRSMAKGEPVYTVPDIIEPEAPFLEADGNIFSSIGRLRTATADGQTVIVTVAFPYDRTDIPFTEELVSKIADFRTIAVSFFASRTADELKESGEESVKQELLTQYNATLTLGSIPLLYFNDFIFLN